LLEADGARGGGGEGDGLAQSHEGPGKRVSAAYVLVLMEVDKAVGPLEADTQQSNMATVMSNDKQ
jgi:hypothetical protein